MSLQAHKPKRHFWVLAVAVMVVLMVGLAVAIVAFTQTSPSTTIPAATPTMTPSCTTLANFTKPAPTTGSLAYSCTGQTDAFTVTNGPVTTTPVIHGLPSSVTLTFYSGAQNLSPCPGTSPSATILNATAMNIASGSYNYCVFYTAITTGLTFTFSVTWS